MLSLLMTVALTCQIKCMKCSGRSERYDRMLDLTVEIDGDICTLEQALAQFTKSETLGGDDKYKCNRYVHLFVILGLSTAGLMKSTNHDCGHSFFVMIFIVLMLSSMLLVRNL